jgi:hypothetical protein
LGLGFLSISTSCCHLLGALSVRCMQPTQQHGRFWPSSSSSTVRSILRLRVFSCLAFSIQQMNSFRASGVMDSQSCVIATVLVKASITSGCNSCTRPPETFLLFMTVLYHLVKCPHARKNSNRCSTPQTDSCVLIH